MANIWFEPIPGIMLRQQSEDSPTEWDAVRHHTKRLIDHMSDSLLHEIITQGRLERIKVVSDNAG